MRGVLDDVMLLEVLGILRPIEKYFNFSKIIIIDTAKTELNAPASRNCLILNYEFLSRFDEIAGALCLFKSTNQDSTTLS